MVRECGRSGVVGIEWKSLVGIFRLGFVGSIHFYCGLSGIRSTVILFDPFRISGFVCVAIVISNVI